MFSYVLAAGMLFLWLVLVPVILGLPFAGLGMECEKRLGTALVCGYMEMWALFQVIAVIFILTTGKFDHVVMVYTGVAAVAVLSSFCWALYRARTHKTRKPVREARILPWKLDNRNERVEKCIEFGVWCLFFVLVVFQVIMSCVMAFGDGDDAYYIPLSAMTEVSGSMYRNIPYTGEATQLDVRHGLAPFPVWIAFLSRMSGVHATILAQSVFGGVLLIVCYLLYSRIAKLLFADHKEGIPYFMLFTALLQLFGNYSFYTAETFLMTRASQGKAVLSNLVLPFLFWCLLQMGQEYRMDNNLAKQHRRPDAESDKRKVLLCILTVFATMASWLCSSLGTFLCAVLIGIGGVAIAIAYRNQKAFWHALACALPSGFFAVFYLVLQII